ncbi:MAG: YlbF family regulator [Bacilli bacterium]|nr:YlbF family regulator [Bacilli bacterium]
MDKVIEKAIELSGEIKNMPEIVEFLRLKGLMEEDKELKELRNNIARLTEENKLEERDNLLKIYNSNPLVNNYEVARENALALLRTVKNVLNK